jgi:hypothetical protein
MRYAYGVATSVLYNPEEWNHLGRAVRKYADGDCVARY